MNVCTYKFAAMTVLVLAISACQTDGKKSSEADPENDILAAYANLAHDGYTQALIDAQVMAAAIDDLADNPSATTLANAKNAWLTARESYGVTEIHRLSNGPIDAEEGWVAEAYGALEGQLNAWPLDENMIDYTIDEKGQRTSGNIIDTAGNFNPGGEDPEAVDISSITEEALAALNENGGEANVATGYHAIEFLLWGQDQDYANFSEDSISKGALTPGQRPLEDFTSAPGAERRLQYLQASTSLLISDLQQVLSAWDKDVSENCGQDARGCYRGALLGQLEGSDSDKNIPRAAAMHQILSGMGVFIKSELANERIAVAVLTPSEEDEHSCFSDNTHRDITLNYQGFLNALKSELGGEAYGDSFYAQASDETRENLDALITKINLNLANMNILAENKWHFDYQILPGNYDREIRTMKNDMRKLGDLMIVVAGDIGLELSSDDVTDAEETQI